MSTTNNSVSSNAPANNSLTELRYNLIQSCSLLINHTKNFLQPYGITPKQYSILLNLALRNPESESIQGVRAGLADKMSDASRLIHRLEKKRFIEKFPSDSDRRSNRVRISAKGLQLLTKIDRQRDHLDRFINERLDEQEVEQLNDLLLRLK